MYFLTTGGIDHSQGRKIKPGGYTAETEQCECLSCHDWVEVANTNPGRIPIGRGGPGVSTMNIAIGSTEVNSFCYTGCVFTVAVYFAIKQPPVDSLVAYSYYSFQTAKQCRAVKKYRVRDRHIKHKIVI